MTATAAEQVCGNRYLLEEILIHLPPKPVTRSKLVSKQWLSQISDPLFVQRHSQLPNKKLHTGMFVVKDGPFISRKCDLNFVSFNALDPKYQTIPSLGFIFDDISVRDSFEITDSCNGLFLGRDECSRVYCVCNPTTKTFRLLPIEPVHCTPGHICTGYLAFNPSVSLHYKVISITRSISHFDNYFRLDIYSSEDKCWKTIVTTIHPSPGKLFIFNGSIYWPSNERSFCFNLYNEEMKPLDFLLPVSPNPWFWAKFSVVGSQLYYTERKDDHEETPDFSVAEMSSDLSQRVPKYEASVRPLVSAYPPIDSNSSLDENEGSYIFGHIFWRYFFSAICVVEGVKDDEVQLVLGIPGKLLLYNLEEKTAKELCDLYGELGGQDNDVPVFQFIETLAVV